MTTGIKRRLLAAAAALVLLLSAGCTKQQAGQADAVQPFDFYYRTVQTGYDGDSGVIAAQIRELGTQTPEVEELFALYLQGPADESLVLPFPQDTELVSAVSGEGVLTLRLSGGYEALTGVNASIADACIAKTMLQLSGVKSVCIMAVTSGGGILRQTTLSEEDLLLQDDSADASNLEILLYFSDESSRYLLAEKRTIPHMDASQLPQYLVEQLIAGPQTAGMYPTIPEGVSLLDINVENGVCAVDFTADFVANRPESEQQERTTLLSVVNTLTELDTISEVQFYVEGRRQETYLYLDISGGFVYDGSAVGPVRPDLNELDATIYLPEQSSAKLHAIPLRVKLTSSESAERAVLQALLSYPSGNGVSNPFFGSLQAASVKVTHGICTVDLNEAYPGAESYSAECGQMRAITATLAALDGVRAVQILVNGAEPAYRFLSAQGAQSPQPNWFCQPDGQ